LYSVPSRFGVPMRQDDKLPIVKFRKHGNTI
jgi:hypothetical protein